MLATANMLLLLIYAELIRRLFVMHVQKKEESGNVYQADYTGFHFRKMLSSDKCHRTCMIECVNEEDLSTTVNMDN